MSQSQAQIMRDYLLGLQQRITWAIAEIDGKALDQSVHGNDFWQTDYDPSTRRWSRTFNIPAADGKPRAIRFQQRP